MTPQPSPIPNILIVDDTPTNLQLLVHMLKESGYKPRPVSSGKLALEASRLAPPDLVLLDINMPDMNGYETCAHFKADDRLKEIPIIFISALNETMDKLKAFAVGGVDYVTKPFNFDEVRARVHTHVELRRQKRQVEESFLQLQKLEKLRDDLTHMIVHDLRSPLMALHGFLDMIEMFEMPTLTPEGKDYVLQGQAVADTLIEMVSTLLDVSKMEAGQMKLTMAPCDLAAIVRVLLARFDSLKGTRTVTLEESPTPFDLQADNPLVGRVIQNLLTNALKFTPDNGCVAISISCDQSQVRLAVKDNGPGIAPQYHQSIFEKFGQVEHKKNRVGTGLGLTFCQLVVKAHGGTIGVQSEPGQGSTFWFNLPLNTSKA